MKELAEKYMDVLEKLDWSVCGYTEDDRVELENYSPAGEDLIICVDVPDFPKSVAEYADGFDVDEHVELWIESRGKDGVPGTARELVEDAEAIDKMLRDNDVVALVSPTMPASWPIDAVHGDQYPGGGAGGHAKSAKKAVQTRAISSSYCGW